MNAFEVALNGSLGCLFFVGFFSLMLYGCTCGQVLYYLAHYGSDDHTYITSMVILIWILDTGKTMVDLICGWDLLVLTHGDLFALLGRLPSILPAEFVLSCSTIFIVQCCYLYTIWRSFTPQLALAVLHATAVSLGTYFSGCGFGAVGAVQVCKAEDIDDAYSRAELAGAIRPGCAAIVDIYITVWLCHHLQDAKTGHKHSDNMVTKLIGYAITRGICTSVAQVLAFALFLVDSKNKTLWSMIFYIPASTLYVNSLLAMWNARDYVKNVGAPPAIPSTWSADIALESRSIRSSLKPPSRRSRMASRPSTLAGSSFMDDFDT